MTDEGSANIDAETRMSPRAELVLAWAVEAVINEFPDGDAEEAVLAKANGDVNAIRAARRVAGGDIGADDLRQAEVNAMLFGPEARLDDVAEGRRRVDDVLERVQARLQGGV